MNLKTDIFQDTCKTILMAVDASYANLELSTKDNILYLSVTNREYFCSLKYTLENPEDFHATVNATLFLDLIAGITTDEFSLIVKNNTIVVKAGKSSYKLPLIYENDEILTLPVIKLENKTVEMPISVDILKSILNVNAKELLKIKSLKVADISELQKLYYIDETGCFTFTTGAVINSFTLPKPIKLLLNDRIVKLFKLFNNSVNFSYGHDTLENGKVQTKAIFETDTVYLAAIITNDEKLLAKVQGPCTATKTFIAENCPNKIVLSVNALSAAIARLLAFNKNSTAKVDNFNLYAKFTISSEEITIIDTFENCETVSVEGGSILDGKTDYEMSLNLFDLKLVLDSCKEEYITLNCGNHRTVVINHGTISHVLPEKN